MLIRGCITADKFICIRIFSCHPMIGERTFAYEALREMIRHRAVPTVLLYLQDHQTAYKKELDLAWRGSYYAVADALDWAIRMKLVAVKASNQPHVKTIYCLTPIGFKVASSIRTCAGEIAKIFEMVPGHKSVHHSK